MLLDLNLDYFAMNSATLTPPTHFTARCFSSTATRCLAVVLAITSSVQLHSSVVRAEVSAEPSQSIAKHFDHCIDDFEPRSIGSCQCFDDLVARERSPGILLNVADCKANDPVAAANVFQEARDRAVELKDQAWVKNADDSLTALGTQVGFIRVPTVEKSVVLTLDGEAILPGTQQLWLAAGQLHRLAATSPGRTCSTVNFTAQVGENPLLEIRCGIAPPPPPPLPLPDNTIAWVVTYSGGAVLAASAIVGLVGFDQKGELDDNCQEYDCPAGFDDKIEDTKDLFLYSDVLLGVGLATLGVGLTLLVFNDDDPTSSHSEIGAQCGPGTCGVLLSGRF